MSDEQLKLEVESIFYTQDAREAIQLSRQLKAEPVLTDFAKSLLPQLQYIRMASLTEDDLVQLLKDHLPAAFSIPEFDLAEKVKWYIDQIQLPNYQVSVAKKIKSLLEGHQAHIGEANIAVKNQSNVSTIGNWITDYNSYPTREGGHDALSQLEYTNKSPNIKNLAPHEVNVLKNILRLYDYVSKLIADWDAVPTPKSEAEAFKDFDLYNFIPGIADESEDDFTSQQPVPQQPITQTQTPSISTRSLSQTPPQAQPRPQPPIRTAPQPTPAQRQAVADITRAPHTPVNYNTGAPGANGAMSASDSAKIRDLINHVPPANKRGVTMDPTNVKIDEEQQRLNTARAKQVADIQRKLAELRSRNNKTQ